MKTPLMISILASLSACSITPSAPEPLTPREIQRLADFTAGRTAGPPTRCISAPSGMKVEAVGNMVIAEWGGRRWVNQVEGSCQMADAAGTFLVTEANSAGQYCQNETFKVVSTSGGLIMGTCTLGPWTPYSR